jgi:hypothetical protein
MLGYIDCWDRGDLGVISSGVSLNCNGSWTEGLEIFSFLLTDLGTVGLGLLVEEEVECDSSQVSGEGLKQVCPVPAKTCHCHSL